MPSEKVPEAPGNPTVRPTSSPLEPDLSLSDYFQRNYLPSVVYVVGVTTSLTCVDPDFLRGRPCGDR